MFASSAARHDMNGCLDRFPCGAAIIVRATPIFSLRPVAAAADVFITILRADTIHA